jgi:hypothetical protein
VNKRKRVGGDRFSPSLFSLSLLYFESLFYRVLSPWAFSPVLSHLLTDNSGSRVPSNGSNQLASRVPKKEMVKGKRHKESLKEPPKESLSVQQTSVVPASVQTLPPKKKKEKASVAHTALPAQPAHPPPIRSVPSTRGTQLTILQRSPPREETKRDRKGKERDETSSESSQEAELDASLAGKKGKKKRGQATLATSLPVISHEDEKEEVSGSEDDLPALGSSAEQSPATSTDFLAGLLGEEE